MAVGENNFVGPNLAGDLPKMQQDWKAGNPVVGAPVPGRPDQIVAKIDSNDGLGVYTATEQAWNGSAWTPLGGGITGPYWPHVWAMAEYNGNLYAGGRFDMAGADSARSIAAWSLTQP